MVHNWNVIVSGGAAALTPPVNRTPTADGNIRTGAQDIEQPTGHAGIEVSNGGRVV